MSRDLGLAYKTAFVICHKMREAMSEELRGRKIGGEGKEAEIDGGYFGGYVKPANLKGTVRTAAAGSTSQASASVLLSFVSAMGIRCQPCSAQKAKP